MRLWNWLFVAVATSWTDWAPGVRNSNKCIFYTSNSVSRNRKIRYRCTIDRTSTFCQKDSNEFKIGYTNRGYMTGGKENILRTLWKRFQDAAEDLHKKYSCPIQLKRQQVSWTAESQNSRNCVFLPRNIIVGDISNLGNAEYHCTVHPGDIHCQDDLLLPKGRNPKGQIGYWHGNKVNNNRSDMKSLWILFKQDVKNLMRIHRCPMNSNSLTGQINEANKG